MELSARLQTVADFVTPGLVTADIGCDHGYTAIYLVEKRKSPHVFAMDIRKGPLKKAEENRNAHGLQDKITLRLSNGMEKLYPGEVQAVVLSGMGGLLMKEILSGKEEVLKEVQELVLQPQSDLAPFRHYLHKAGFRIEKEAFLYDMGKYYTVIKAVHGEETYDSEMEYEYGKLLIQEKPEAFLEFLHSEQRRIEPIVLSLEEKEGERIQKRCQELERTLSWIDSICSCK